jgi:hypothetical protein
MRTGIIDVNGRDSGYDIIPDPDMDLSPISIIDENYNKLGDLPDFLSFSTEAELPKIKRDEKKAELKHVFVSSTDANLHVGLMESCLARFGLFSAETKIDFKDTKTFEMKFTNILSDSILPVDLAKFISKGTIVMDENIRHLISRASKSFVIYDIIKSNMISISLKNGQGAGATTDISVVKDTAKVSSGINMDQTADSTLTYSSPEPLTIGIKQYGFWASKTFFSRQPIAIFEPGVSRPRITLAPKAGRGKSFTGGKSSDVASSIKTIQEVSFDSFSQKELKPARMNPDKLFRKSK